MDWLANGQLNFWPSGGQEAVPYQNSKVLVKFSVLYLVLLYQSTFTL